MNVASTAANAHEQSLKQLKIEGTIARKWVILRKSATDTIGQRLWTRKPWKDEP